MLALLSALSACAAPAARHTSASSADSIVAAFGDSVAASVIDSTRFELRGFLFVKILNPNRDDESPLADEAVRHPASPGPHTMDGTLYADVDALQQLLGRSPPVRVDTVREVVYVGDPPVLLVGHRHGSRMYVPVRLFARQFGAYADIRCTLANCGYIWPRAIIDSMARGGPIGTGVLGAHADGIGPTVDVTRLPSG